MTKPFLPRLPFVLPFAAVLLASVAAAEEIPSDPAPRWWKGNLHTHSLWSDGNDFPETIAEWYRDHDYHFLAISDHNVLSEGQKWMSLADVDKRSAAKAFPKYLARFGSTWVETRDAADGVREVRLKPIGEYRALVEERGRFLLIPSEEITDQAAGVPVHLNATNIGEAIRPLGGATVREAIQNNIRAVEEQAKSRGREIVVHLNHPNYGFAITAEDLAAVVLERFFEVFNGHPGVRQLGDATHPSVDRLWDVANAIRIGRLDAPPLYGIATDDSHDYHQQPNSAQPGRGWTTIRARRLTPESLVRAMRQGDMYASSGVVLDDVRYDAEAGTVELDIHSVENATFTTQFIGTTDDYIPADGAGQDGTAKKLAQAAEAGRVLAESTDLHPKYRLTGRELYVRAVVTSSQPHGNPTFDGQKQQAWTQPVGWEKRLETSE